MTLGEYVTLCSNIFVGGGEDEDDKVPVAVEDAPTDRGKSESIVLSGDDTTSSASIALFGVLLSIDLIS